MKGALPVFGICGYSGSGKTTLIIELIRQLSGRGLKVGVVKHDTHGINIDHEGKDSDRIFKAGADILIRSPEQVFFRSHRRGADVPLESVLRQMGPRFDLILVEGHKTTPLAEKIWLCGEDGDRPPAEAGQIRRVLQRDEERPRIVMAMIDEWLPAVWSAAPLYAGILIGGRSSRMGRPKHLLPAEGQSWIERTAACVQGCVDRVVLLGSGEIPVGLRGLPALSDVDDAQGPLRGMLAAMRWAPLTSWIFLPCDAPLLSAAAIRWLIRQRRPGTWAVLPVLPGAPAPEPLPALYEFRVADLLERVRGPIEIASGERVATPPVPPELADGWVNVNTPDELARHSASRDGGRTGNLTPFELTQRLPKIDALPFTQP
jgi:molybdopterin-guanine dinucleotide biosynthesis protein MobB